MVSGDTVNCRKCGVENPALNQYCRHCGAVLKVSTRILKAQRLPVVPRDGRFKWRFVFIGVFVMVGMAAAAIALAIFLGLNVGIAEKGVIDGLASFSATVGGIFLASFGVSGFLLSLLAGRAAGKESFIAAILAVTLLGVVGSVLAFDLLITAAVVLLPAGVSAWFGARFKRASSDVRS